MKKLLYIILITWYCNGYAQMIQVTTGQTTSLVFPFPIQHVDRGSANVLVQPVPEATNILLVKAAHTDFPLTNLTVITRDGSTYALAMQYVVNPTQWVYTLDTRLTTSPEIFANGIINNTRTISGMKDHSWDMHARVMGIYIKDKTIYFQLQLRNASPLDYEPEFLRFFIRDRRRGKRAATQENEVIPRCIAGNTREVKAHHEQSLVIALDKFTIPDAKYLAIQVMEKNGGRHLLLKVSNRKIIRAIPLSDVR